MPPSPPLGPPLLLLRSLVITKRSGDLEDDDGYSWYDSQREQTTKYAIFFGILLACCTFILVAYTHARRRLKKNHPPLRYHRWLLSKQDRAIHEPRFREPIEIQTFGPFSRQNRQPAVADEYVHPIPPPVYNPNYVQPPPYSGARENSPKANPAPVGEVES